MNRLVYLCLLGFVFALSGCAVLEQPEMNAVRASGLEPYLIDKMEHGDRLSPSDIIAASHRVSDDILVRYISRTGVAFQLTRELADRMRRNGVSSRVLRVVSVESQRYVEDYVVSRAVIESDYLYPGPYYGGGFYYYGGGYRHHHHHGHHRHHRHHR